MAKLAHAYDSGSYDSNIMRVQVPSAAYIFTTLVITGVIFCHKVGTDMIIFRKKAMSYNVNSGISI